MSAQEFIDEFDILYNSIASNVAPAIDDYEKSVFLTQAQEQVVNTLYGDFETSEQNRKLLRAITTHNVISPLTSYAGMSEYDNTLYRYTFPTEGSDSIFKGHLLYLVREYATIGGNSCHAGKQVNVQPIQLDQYSKVIANPFRGPSYRRVIRTDYGGKINIESKYPLTNYIIDYIRKPYPIILVDLSDTGLKIDNQTLPLWAKTGGTEGSDNDCCELDVALHKTILQTAVSMAQAVYQLPQAQRRDDD